MSLDDGAYTRAMFGQHAVHVPLNFIVQGVEGGKILLLGQSDMPGPHPLAFGSQKIHQLIMGDMIFRPHLVLESDHLRGHGASGILKGGWDVDDWVREGTIILDPLERFTTKAQRK